MRMHWCLRETCMNRLYIEGRLKVASKKRHRRRGGSIVQGRARKQDIYIASINPNVTRGFRPLLLEINEYHSWHGCSKESMATCYAIRDNLEIKAACACCVYNGLAACKSWSSDS